MRMPNVNDRSAILTVQTPQGEQAVRTTLSDQGQPLTKVLRQHGQPLNTRCGDRGLCRGCLVHVLAGELQEIQSGAVVGASDEPVRACQHRLAGDSAAMLLLPERSLTSFAAHTVSDFVIDLPHAHDPLWRGDRTGCEDGPPPVGVAIDVGTTTVAVMLVDLASGEILSRAGAFNRQVDHGDNVLTRIDLCRADAANVSRLQDAVVNQTIAVLLQEAMSKADISAEQVVCFTAAGNPTMLHLLAGEDPSSMGVAPFTPVFLEHRSMAISQVGLRWAGENGRACNGSARATPLLHLLPAAAAYIGSDLTAGVVATGMRYQPGTTLLIDVGTNGEIILGHEGRLLGCATAAGPAFEGGGLTDGVRAGDGAISHLTCQGEPVRISAEVIGSSKPIGLCGSAYIDFLAEGVRCGALGATGRLNLDVLHPEVALRSTNGACHGNGVVVARGQGNRPIVIHDADIAKLLQAKAAIAAGILTLLDRAGLTPADVDTVYLAGGFGRHVNVKHAIACGLLPGFNEAQVKLVGNLSLGGAFLALLDRAMLAEMSAAAKAIEPVELNLEPGFEEHFIDQLMLPA